MFRGKGVILDEPTMIAVDVETGMPIAIGNAAYTIMVEQMIVLRL